MLLIKNLEVEFGGRILFSNLNFTINVGDRITFAGYNGTGKSTLMKVIAGVIESTKGEIIKNKNVSIGYLPQDGIHISGKSLFKEIESSFSEIFKIQDEIDELGDLLDKTPVEDKKYYDILDQMGDLQLKLGDHDIDKIKPQIESILSGLGFSRDDFERDTGEFSGGWQMRIAMAKLFLQKPDVLLLDEPTNHLDIESQKWIENYLKFYQGALVLISHDKGLLDLLCNQTLAFAHGKITEYSGNYSYFIKESALRKEQLLKAKENQDKEIKEIQDFINRFRYNSKKSTLVQSRIKMLSKIERITVDKDDAVVNFKFPQPPKSGNIVLKIDNVKKQYDDLVVFENLDLIIEKGDCIAVVGVNGAGKSTFVRLLAEIDKPTDGDITKGYNVLPSYFSQTLSEELPMDKTIIETVQEVANKEVGVNIRNVLGCFLFRGNDVFKQNNVLSGGERSRVALVRMLLQPANFLIMDEPTNHLDIPSQEILQHALKNYEGTMVIVSHSREFLDPIVNKVIEFIPNEAPRTYIGNITDYLEKKERDQASLKENLVKTDSKTIKALKSSENKVNKKSKKDLRREKAEIREKTSRLKKSLIEVEANIKEVERVQSELIKNMSNPDFAQNPDNIKSLEDCKIKLGGYYTKWEKIDSELELFEPKD